MEDGKIFKEEPINGLYVDNDDLQGDISDIINRLEEIKNKVSELGYNTCHIYLDRSEHYVDVIVRGMRLETDEEFEKRKEARRKMLEREKKRQQTIAEKRKQQRAKDEAIERAEYERLKAKFEHRS